LIFSSAFFSAPFLDVMLPISPLLPRHPLLLTFSPVHSLFTHTQEKSGRGLMRFFALIPVLCAAVVAAGQSAPAAKSATPADGVRSDMLVSTQWLSQHLKDPNVVVLHLADSVLDYKRGHIPGAHFIDMNKITTKNGNVTTELPSVEQLQKAFADAGVSDKSRVIIYATNWFPNGARVWYTLDYLGHGEQAALLDGGIEQWLVENRPVSGETPAFSPASFTPHVNEKVRALIDEAKADTEPEANEQLVDARPEGRYKSGHLAGANNVYWQDTLVSEDNPVFKSPEQLRALYAAKGVVPNKKIVTYCEVGMQASHGYFLAKYLGYDAALYDGSYQEWSGKNMPVVKGDAKR
jgi:thiosulfate/3-mercaptopyruvate sulfurtransferase